MQYTKHAKPHVLHKIQLAKQANMVGNHAQAFNLLEDAHVIGQKSTYLHCLVHYLMLKHGFEKRDIVEVFGQILRIFGALTKTCFGLLPSGNTGGSNVGPFTPMPISAQNKRIIDAIEQKILD